MTRRSIAIVIGLVTLGWGVAWILSYVAPLHSGRAPRGFRQIINVRDGRLTVYRSRGITAWDNVREERFVLPGFALFTYAPQSGGRRWDMVLQLWMPFVLFAVYPTVAFIRGPLRRWRRYKKGFCLNCGYDLRGSVSDVCSECGAPK